MTTTKVKPEHNVQIPMEVLLHKGLDGNAIRVFAYMKFRYQFFRSIGRSYTESNTTISEACGISRSTLIRVLKILSCTGFVYKEMRTGEGGGRSEQTNIYTVKDCIITKASIPSKNTTLRPQTIYEDVPDEDEPPF